jgi:muramoyltetrapeptide carboxypeptidase
LLGGNLTVFTTIIGSEYLPDFKDSILFLEDVEEAPYGLHRMFTPLKLAGILNQTITSSHSASRRTRAR